MLNATEIIQGLILLVVSGGAWGVWQIVAAVMAVRQDVEVFIASFTEYRSKTEQWQKMHGEANATSFDSVHDQIVAHEALDVSRFEALDSHVARIDTRIDAVRM